MLNVDCAICLEVLEDPVRLRPCGHGFCRSCLGFAVGAGQAVSDVSPSAPASLSSHSAPAPSLSPVQSASISSLSATAEAAAGAASSGALRCPLCRQAVAEVETDYAAAHALSMRFVQCPSCGMEMAATALRKHKDFCEAERRATQEAVRRAQQQANPLAPQMPNRSTFKCPFPDCEAANMDGKDLCNHFETAHKNSTCSAVCPVCVSMPWGDPNYVSRDIVNHIRLRHRFTYDEYVDYQEADDEDAILQAVLKQSLQQR